MNILFSVHRYHPNHDGLVSGLIEAGHKVSFLVHWSNPTEEHPEGVEVVVLEQAAGSRRLLGTNAESKFRRYRVPPNIATLRRVFGGIRPDLIIARDTTLVNYLLFLGCRLRGIGYFQYVQSHQGFEEVLLRPRIGRVMRLLARVGLWPQHTINTTMFGPERPIAGKTFDFIPFSLRCIGPEKANYPSAAPVAVIAVGKLDHPDKRNAELVTLLAPDLRAGRATLTIAGLRAREITPTYQRLLDTIRAEGVGDRARVLENLGYDQVRALYAGHDLFIMPNTREVAGIAPVEAMASGLATIFTSDNGTNYFARPGETGFVFRDGDFDDLRGRIAYFLDDIPELGRMGRNARRLIEEQYSPADFERRLMALVARYYPRLRGVAGVAAEPDPGALVAGRVPGAVDP